jgi:hypothetical protein
MEKRNLKRVLKSTLLMALLLAVVSFNKSVVNAAGTNSFTADTIKTGDESVQSYCEGTLTTGSTSSSSRSDIIAVTTDCSGLLSFYYQGTNTKTVYFNLYSDAACSKEVDYGKTLEASTEAQETKGFEVPKAGTYYLKIASYDSSDITYKLSGIIYSSDDDSVSANTYRVFSLLGSDDVNYYKINVNKTGVTTVIMAYADSSECDGDLTIKVCKKTNGVMKELASGKSSIDGSSFALAKGTYYLKVSGYSSDYYQMGYKVKEVKDKSGSKKTKAASIKWKGTASGLILATDKTSKADWYKFSNSTKRKVTVTLKGTVTGSVTLEFMGAKGDSFGKMYINEYKKEAAGSAYVGTYYSSSGKLPKGTYYIKVTKEDMDVSGSYSISIK